MAQHISITFVRGARRVTGAQFLVEAIDEKKTTRVVVDCGLAQGERFCETVNTSPFPYEPASIDALFFTHAHADHIGLFPRLAKEGFHGKAYATPPTKDLLPIMLEDSAHLLFDEANRCGESPLYMKEDVGPAVSRVEALPYRKTIPIAPGIEATFYNAGHIVGSASVLLSLFGTRIVFTGDLGRVPATLVQDRDIPENIDYLVCESVYGDRTHEPFENAVAVLHDAIKSVIKAKGVLLIPAFSLERTQIILEEISRARKTGAIPAISVFLDSPLATKVTKVYRENTAYLRDDIQTQIKSGVDPFSFPELEVTEDADASRAIAKNSNPKVIIAGAGMSHGGRIRGHEKTFLSHPNTTLLLVGYQVAGSLGRRLKDGVKEVTIDGVKIPVRATIRSTEGFSAHADRDDLLSYVEKMDPKKVFVVLGETAAATFFAQRVTGFLGISADVPREGEQISLEIRDKG